MEQATKQVNQLLNLSRQDTQPAGAAHDAGHGTKKDDSKAPKPSEDKGNAQPGDVSPQGAASAGPASPEPGNGNGNGNGNGSGSDQGQGNGQANGAGNGKKAEPSPVEQVIAAVTDLLP